METNKEKEKVRLRCQECGRRFTKVVGPKTQYWKLHCPKCKSLDIDFLEFWRLLICKGV